MSTNSTTPSIMSHQELLDHWQGHRKLTRKVIETYPDEHLFTFSVGGMRPFAELIQEMLHMTAPGVEGIITGTWNQLENSPMDTARPPVKTKKDLLERWDETTAFLNKRWPDMTIDRYHINQKAFEMYEGNGLYFIFYFIDNEIHHRAQGYVYLRVLGIEPPGFWDRD